MLGYVSVLELVRNPGKPQLAWKTRLQPNPQPRLHFPPRKKAWVAVKEYKSCSQNRRICTYVYVDHVTKYAQEFLKYGT